MMYLCHLIFGGLSLASIMVKLTGSFLGPSWDSKHDACNVKFRNLGSQASYLECQVRCLTPYVCTYVFLQNPLQHEINQKYPNSFLKSWGESESTVPTKSNQTNFQIY